MMFVQRLNSAGIPEWVVLDGDGPDDVSESDDVLAGLLQRSHYLDMLHDKARNRAYRLAIQHTISAGTRTVLDIGTGTGLLAIMAARHLRALSPDTVTWGHVTACDLFPPMVSLARRVVAANSLQEHISVLGKRSDEIIVACPATPLPASSVPPRGMAGGEEMDMEKKADVIVTEIFDSELLGEGIIPSLRDALPRLLKEGGHVIPAGAQIWAQVVECDILWHCWDLEGCERAAGISPRLTQDTVVGTPAECPASPLDESAKASSNARVPQTGDNPHVAKDGTGCADPRCRLRSLHMDPLRDRLRALSDPFPLFKFDFQDQLTLHPNSLSFKVPVTLAGVAHAFVVWWDLHMDPMGQYILSTRPGWVDTCTPPPGMIRQEWREHWKSCWAPFSPVGSFEVGEEVEGVATHDEVSVFISAGHLPVSPSLSWVDALSPDRTWALADPGWRSAFQSAAAHVLGSTNPGAVVVTLGDGPLLALSAAHNSTTSHVVSIQETRAGQRSVAELAEAAGVASRLDSCSLASALSRSIDILAGRGTPNQATLAGRGAPTQASLVLAEPYYRDCQEEPPWAHLRFWRERDRLLRAGVLSPEALLLPHSGSVKAVLVSLPELYRTQQPISEVEGINLSPCSSLLGWRGHNGVSAPLARPVWQCGSGYAELSHRQEVFHLSFRDEPFSQSATAELMAHAAGTAHAIVMWIDYLLVPGCTTSLVRGLNPSGMDPDYKRQAIFLLEEAVEIRSPTEGGSPELDTRGHPVAQLSTSFPTKTVSQTGNPPDAIAQALVQPRVANDAPRRHGEDAREVRGVRLQAHFNAQTLDIDIEALAWL
eukprot:jgi/Botrbrau1/13705/Bobra.250_2s0004.3